MAKSLARTFQFDVLDDGRLLFQSRYYAQRFIDEYLSSFPWKSDYVIDREVDGFILYWKLPIFLDDHEYPVLRFYESKQNKDFVC